jgi:hypothetical protein
MTNLKSQAAIFTADQNSIGTAIILEIARQGSNRQGDVEVFDLRGHPKAKRAYAWSHLDGENDERTRFIAVLEIPPVISPETTVRVQIVKDFKGKK